MAGFSAAFNMIPIPKEMEGMTPLTSKHAAIQLRGALLAAVVNTSKDMKKAYERSTATWMHKPTFVTTQSYAGGAAMALVYTNNQIYQYIDKGTGARYATMNPGFKPKTRPGSLDSSAGSYGTNPWAGTPKQKVVFKDGVWFVSRRFPKAGIRARNFSMAVGFMYLPILRTRVHDAIRVYGMTKGAPKPGWHTFTGGDIWRNR